MFSRSRKGFTLAELMIVIGVIGILAASLYPSLSKYLARGRDSTRVTDMQILQKALLAYKVDFGIYPNVSTYYTSGTVGFVSDCKSQSGTLLEMQTEKLISNGTLTKFIGDPNGNWPLCYMYKDSDYGLCPGINNGFTLIFATESVQYPQFVKYGVQGENGSAGRYCYNGK